MQEEVLKGYDLLMHVYTQSNTQHLRPL
jgi:hypothetical protein